MDTFTQRRGGEARVPDPAPATLRDHAHRPAPSPGSGRPRPWRETAGVGGGVPLLIAALAAGAALGVGRSRWLWLIALLAVLCALALAGVTALQVRLRRLARDLAALQSREAALGAERELLLHEALAAADREKQRLAADLHDGVIQLVSAITLRTATLARGLRRAPTPSAQGNEDAAASLDRITVDLQAVTVDLRTLMGELAGADVQGEGLTGALGALLTPLAESGVTVDVSVGELSCGAQTRSLLHRAAQELVRNVAKHAAARRVQVSANQEGETVTFVLADDGRGFDPADLDQRGRRGHMGLRLLDQRVREAGGTFDLVSAPGRGARATVTLPAAPTAAA